VKTKVTPKIADQGIQCMFLGYTINHTGNTYQIWDLKTQDAIWMKRMFYSKPTLVLFFAVVTDDINIAIPQQEAGESIDPEESANAGPDTANESLEERDDDKSMSDSLTGPTPVTSTRSGQTSNQPTRLIEEAGTAMPDLELDLEEYKSKLTHAKEHCVKL
jgi:hypothetical protein